jgi:2-phosphosulfolactate phosphatase
VNFHYTNLETCHEATGTVVVIDVIRAFTNAAFAFSRGAKEIYPVSGVGEALALKARNPQLLVFGEVNSVPPEGFDFGNSPTEMMTLDLTGLALVQRTSSGTQGIVRSSNASHMLAASFVVASGTVAYIRDLGVDDVTFVITGALGNAGGSEDFACAEYLEAKLKGQLPESGPYSERVYRSRDGFAEVGSSAFPRSDLDCCATVDAFDFAMPVTIENGRRVMRATRLTRR